MRLVLFDCDGTIVDSQVMIVTAMTRAFEAGGMVAPAREEILSIVGLSLPIAIARLAGDYPAATVDMLVESYKTAFFDLRNSTLHHEPLYPSAREVIEALAADDDTLLGVVTGKSMRGLLAILAMHGLRDHFQVLKTADGAPSKPHPAMVLEAMAEMGVDADRTVVIGDTSFDMEMAKAAGCHALGVTWGYHDRALLRSSGADRLVERYDEIPAAIQALLGDERKTSDA